MHSDRNYNLRTWNVTTINGHLRAERQAIIVKLHGATIGNWIDGGKQAYWVTIGDGRRCIYAYRSCLQANSIEVDRKRRIERSAANDLQPTRTQTICGRRKQ